MIYQMILKKRQILQTLRWFYRHGLGQILMALSALIYEPYLILYTNQIFYQEFYLFHISSHAFIPLLTCSLLQCCLELTFLWVSVTACNSTPWAKRTANLYSVAGHVWLWRSGSDVPAVCPVSFDCMFRVSACAPKPSHAVEEHRDVPSGVSDPDRMMDHA